MVRTTEQKTKAWEDVDKARARFINEYETAFLAALNAQIAPVIVAVKRGKENPENYLVELPISEVLSDLYKKVGLVFAVREYRAVMRLKMGVPNIAFKISNAEEPQSQWLRFVRGWLGTEGLEKAKQITDTVKKFVKRTLDIAVKDGLSIDQTAKLIIDEHSDINKSHAELIARTEIVSASNKGSLEGARSTGLKLNKIWFSTPDGRTRRTPRDNFNHAAADEQTRPLDGLFDISGEKLDHPGDSGHGASGGNVIRCRCTLGYEPV